MAKEPGKEKGMGKGMVRSVAELLDLRQKEIMVTWLANIRALAGTRTKELMTAGQLDIQATDFLRVITEAFRSEVYDDMEHPSMRPSVQMLKEISASRAQQGFTASETATFIFSLQDAIMEYLQIEIGDNPELLNKEIIKMSKIIVKMGLLTFETFAVTREEVIGQQARSIMELSTPALRVWDEVLLLPLIGTFDTPRAQQMMETVLQVIVDTESRVLLLDVTGVPVMDTKTASHLLKTVEACRMLGCDVIITGISPSTAQTMTKLSIELAIVKTMGTLRAGMVEAYKLIGREVVMRS